jgi:hypothetical protein
LRLARREVEGTEVAATVEAAVMEATEGEEGNS